MINMIEFKRNPKTGKIEVWKDGKRHGEVVTMGDKVKKSDGRKNRNHG